MSTAKKLIVYSVDLNTMKKSEMASFELHGDEVKATYKNLMFEGDIDQGLYDHGKMVTPEDGKKFMDVLERSYSSSSTIIVERA